MHRSFLSIFIDPATREELELEVSKEDNGFIIEGNLRSKSNTYPIVRGIPRFAGYNINDNYAKSFGWQWNKWKKVQFESENKGKPLEGWTRNMWEKCTGQFGKLEGQFVVDYGCGPGRFIDIAREKGARVVGLDFSDAVEAAAQNFPRDPNVLVVQGDILNPPFREGVFDGAFSIGVLHHTPDPKKGAGEIFKTVKSDGWCGIAVYGQGGYYDLPAVKFWRRVFKFLWPVFGHYPPYIYSWIATYILYPLGAFPWTRTLVNSFYPFIGLKDHRWRMLDTFDSVTPSHQSGHSPYEVFMWFKDAGMKKIEPSDWYGPVVNGRR